MSTDPDKALARQGRLAAIVIAATALLWVGANWAWSKLGWSYRTLAFFDLAALAGFLWALIVTFRIWRARRDK